MGSQAGTILSELWLLLRDNQITLKTKQGKNLIASHLNALDRISNDVMVVLVPIDQIKNTSYKVSEHTFDTICTELHRARTIMKKLKKKVNLSK